jgi:hypothetical protein
MVKDINALIDFFKKYTSGYESKGDMEEQDDAAASSSTSSSGGGGGSIPKWADFYTTSRGKANMLGKTGEKWNTGLNRGAANQIW